MRNLNKKITPAVTALLVIFAVFTFAPALHAQSDELDSLFQQLKDPVAGDWKSVEKRIWKAWSHSGSDAMDLLLERGRREMRAGNFDKSLEHLTALTDHAPDFAEGWNARATLFFMMGEYALSVADIEHTLALNPRHFGAMSGLGMILERVDEPKKALKVYRQAIAIHPFRPDLLGAVKRLEEKTGGTSL